MSIKIKQELHGIDIADLEGLIKEREDEEFTIRSKFDSHNFISCLNLLIKMKLNLSSF